jgi:hypothetical protein
MNLDKREVARHRVLGPVVTAGSISRDSAGCHMSIIELPILDLARHGSTTIGEPLNLISTLMDSPLSTRRRS